MSKDQSPSHPPLGFWATVSSVMAAFFGVRSQANRARDFSRGRPLAFIVIGLALTGVLVAAILVAVRVAMTLAHGG